MSNFKTLTEYFSGSKQFVVPYYQRGYKWSLQKNEERGELHLVCLLTDLKKEFLNSLHDGKIAVNYEYPLQGITVKEAGGMIELVDGQQRTTSLFILFCLLKNKNVHLDFSLDSKLKYDVRVSANIVLQGFVKGICEGDDKVQDIAALKNAWRLCEKHLNDITDLPLFSEFVLNNVKIIYIKLDSNQDETRVFSMMNQDKAKMSNTDLVKSVMLRQSSRQAFQEIAQTVAEIDSTGLEWQINQLRTKLANEWDVWRKWWENEEHQKFVRMLDFPLINNANEPKLSVLLIAYDHIKTVKLLKQNNKKLYEYFKLEIEKFDNNKIKAIEIFGELRLLHQIIQEWYEDPSIYNFLGLIFKGSGIKDKWRLTKKLIREYKVNKIQFPLVIKNEYVSAVLGEKTKDDFIFSILNDKNVYYTQYNVIARQLLRMNVTRANRQGHKFDFELYEEIQNESQLDKDDISKSRSLEHIKSQTYRNNNLSELDFKKLESLTNTIGNLVLLPRGLNSKLSNNSFENKKASLFKELSKREGKNYGLWLHTLEIFGKYSTWQIKDIEENREVFHHEFNEFFK